MGSAQVGTPTLVQAYFFANFCPKPKTDLRVLRFRETVEFREHFLILRKENLPANFENLSFGVEFTRL